MAWMYIPWLFIRIEKRYYPRLIRVKDMSVMEKFDGTILKQHNNVSPTVQIYPLPTTPHILPIEKGSKERYKFVQISFLER